MTVLTNIDAIMTRRKRTTPASVRVFIVEPFFSSQAVNTAMAPAINHRAGRSTLYSLLSNAGTVLTPCGSSIG